MTGEVQAVWEACITHLQDKLSTPSSRTWFAETEPVSISEDSITLRAPNPFAKEWLEQRYSELLAEGLLHASGRQLRVEILTRPAQETALASTAQAPPNPAPPPAPPVPSPTDAEAGFSPRYTFESFVIGASNRFAHAAAMAVAEAPASAYNPLFIYGHAGLGKTHLLHALGRHTIDLYPHMRIRYVSSETFVNEFIAAIRGGGGGPDGDFLRRYRNADVLLVDDIQFLGGKEATQEEFFHTFNALHNANKQIVMSSDRPPKEIAKLEDRLRSRFEWGLITDIQPPDLETRIAILRKKAEMDHLTVPEDILSSIAEKVESNIRELEGALIRVIAYASLNRTNVTLDLVEEVLGQLFPANFEPIRPDTILAECAGYYGLTIDDLRSSNRTRPIVHARQTAMYLTREVTDLSLPKIGEIFGGRDHTTVMHAVAKIRALILEKRQVYHQVQDLTARIRKRSGS